MIQNHELRTTTVGARNGRPIAGIGYTYRGNIEHDQAQVTLARIRAHAAELVDGPGAEWYRELAAEQRDDQAPIPVSSGAWTPPPVSRADCATRDHRPEPVVEWCDRCGYRTTAIGHTLTCGTP